jgi:pyruvate,water dikinase
LYTAKLESVNRNRNNVGNKAIALGEMINAGLPVPPGFAVTMNTFERFLRANKITNKIAEVLGNINYNEYSSVRNASAEIQSLITNGSFPDYLERPIKEDYEEISVGREAKEVGGVAYDLIKAGRSDIYVAVRSSLSSEELPYINFDGQAGSMLNIRGMRQLLDAIKECWASLFTPRAMLYRKNKRISKVPTVGVVVQKMLDPSKSGFAFTSYPEKNDRSKIIIEACWGMGESISSGIVTPDEYVADKESGSIISRKVRKKLWMKKRDEMYGKSVKEPVPRDKTNLQVLSDGEIRMICDLSLKAEKNFNTQPQDIEWCVERNKIYLLQSRSLSSFGVFIQPQEPPSGKGSQILNGIPASLGITRGNARIITGPADFHRIEKGDIAVLKMTYPEIIPVMNRIGGIITDDGGRMCHAATTSREFDTPCVVATESGTSLIKDGQEILLDANEGNVYEIRQEPVPQPAAFQPSQFPAQPAPAQPSQFPAQAQPVPFQASQPAPEKEEFGQAPDATGYNSVIPSQASEPPASDSQEESPTATKTGINLTSPEINPEALGETDSLSLLRSEYLLADLGRHPFSLAKTEPERLVSVLSEKLGSLARSLYPRKLFYKGIDIRTDELTYLEGGDEEPKEQNPSLGWHGIRRSIDSNEILKCELDALRKLSSQGVNNIHYAIPFVSGEEEVKAFLEAVDFPLKVGLMVETPAAAIDIENLCKEGISFVIINYDTLAQLSLGVDRDNANVSRIYSESSRPVINLIKHAIRSCRNRNVLTLVSGDMTSSPQMVEELVSVGSDYIFSDTENIEDLRREVSRIERKLILENIRKE